VRTAWIVAWAVAGCSSAAAPLDAGDAEVLVPVDAASDVAEVDASSTDAGDEVAVDAPADAPDAKVVCPADMVHVGASCVDRYEAPNEPGARPLAFQTAPEGQAFCAARGKRLCTEAEWVRACEGAGKRPYPYGASYVRGRCNDDKTWIAPNWTTLGTYPSAAATKEAARLYQADPSGSRAGCASEDGVMDLTGNVAEWVVRSFPTAAGHEHVLKGCYWSGCYGGSPPSCGFVNGAHPGTFRTYEAGFRCCKDAG
jgi:formylglycine-generating enzyme required for sulfatase activity